MSLVHPLGDAVCAYHVGTEIGKRRTDVRICTDECLVRLGRGRGWVSNMSPGLVGEAAQLAEGGEPHR